MTTETKQNVATPMFKSSRLDVDELARERLSTATELLSGWVWETDSQHRFTYMSDSVETFTGYPPEWHYGKTREEVGNICDPDQLESFLLKIEAHEPFAAVEFTRMEDERLCMRTAGKPYYRDDQFGGYRGIAYRISSELRERRLRRAAERQQADTLASIGEVIFHHPDGIVVFDVHRRIVFANDKYYKALGIRPRDLPIGSSLEALVEFMVDRAELTGGSIEKIVNHQVELAKAGKSFVFERSRPNGRILKVQGFPLTGGGCARTFTDVTERAEDKWTIGALRDKISHLSGRPLLDREA